MLKQQVFRVFCIFAQYAKGDFYVYGKNATVGERVMFREKIRI